KCRELAIMKERSAQFDVSQAWRSKLAQIIVVSRDLKTPCVLILRTDAIVMEDIVRSQSTAMTNGAAVSGSRENISPALFGLGQRSNACVCLVNRRLIAVERSLVCCHRHCDLGWGDIGRA